MRTAIKTGWVHDTSSARVTLWFQTVDPNGDIPLETPVFRAEVNGVVFARHDGSKHTADLGRTEKNGEIRNVATGPMLSGYEVFADLVETGKLSSKAANALAKYIPELVTAMTDAAQAYPPTATELAEVTGLADAVSALDRADKAEAKAQRLQAAQDAKEAALSEANDRAEKRRLLVESHKAELDRTRNELAAVNSALAALRTLTP